jgi:DoxX-like family
MMIFQQAVKGTIMTRESKTRLTILIGRLMSAAVVAVLLADAAVSTSMPHLIAAQYADTGFSLHQAPTLGVIMLVCALTYAWPRTSTLGAILITGFLGGAICTHVRLGELFSPPQLISLVLGALAWGGLYLRDARLRDLLPVASKIPVG